MSAPKIIIVKESEMQLKALLKGSSKIIVPRIKMLLVIKQNQQTGISKRALADLLGVNPNSVQTWRSIYEQGGLSLLCSHKKTGFRPSVFNQNEHQMIEQKLMDSKNGLRGYTELLTWIEQEFGKPVKYNTLLKYCTRKFASKIKVARKSHVKKDQEAVEAFKKTSLKSADRPSKQK